MGRMENQCMGGSSRLPELNSFRAISTTLIKLTPESKHHRLVVRGKPQSAPPVSRENGVCAHTPSARFN